MAKNNSPPLHVSRLQRVVAEEITDPAERAALDELRRRIRENGDSSLTEDLPATPPPEAITRLMELSRQLPPAERCPWLARVSAELASEKQFSLLARALKQIAPEVLHALEEELVDRLESRSN